MLSYVAGKASPRQQSRTHNFNKPTQLCSHSNPFETFQKHAHTTPSQPTRLYSSTFRGHLSFTAAISRSPSSINVNTSPVTHKAFTSFVHRTTITSSPFSLAHRTMSLSSTALLSTTKRPPVWHVKTPSPTLVARRSAQYRHLDHKYRGDDDDDKEGPYESFHELRQDLAEEMHTHHMGSAPFEEGDRKKQQEDEWWLARYTTPYHLVLVLLITLWLATLPFEWEGESLPQQFWEKWVSAISSVKLLPEYFTHYPRAVAQRIKSAAIAFNYFFLMNYPYFIRNWRYLYQDFLDDLENIPLLPEPLPQPFSPPYTLVLDLEALLCPIYPPGGRYWRFYRMRPGWAYFIGVIKDYFEVVITTDWRELESELIVGNIDPHVELFHHRIYQDDWEYDIATPDQKTRFRYTRGSLMFYKDPTRLGRDLARLIQIDTKPYNKERWPDNILYLPPWDYRDATDETLLDVLGLLEDIYASGTEDVRDVIRQFNDVGDLNRFFAVDRARRERDKKKRILEEIEEGKAPGEWWEPRIS